MSLDGQRRYLLLQVRNDGDPMRGQEVGCFAKALGCTLDRVTPHNLLAGGPSSTLLGQHDLVLIGGSGDYSAAGEGPWLDRALETLREICAVSKPLFASCWGFQALARALGGVCIHDLDHAELGPTQMTLSAAGREDPVFGELPPAFYAHSGHEDRVASLPEDAVLLASSEVVAQQAFRLQGRPVYATQFHPELRFADFMSRVENYPRYVEQIAGVSIEEFRARRRETPEANALLKRMADWALS